MQQICLSLVLNGFGKVMSLIPFIKCTCITGDDLKEHDCVFSNPVKLCLVCANVLSYEINIV